MKVKRTIGKQEVVPFVCPVCKEQTGEKQVGKDISCPLGYRKETTLCYTCGYSSSILIQDRKNKKEKNVG